MSDANHDERLAEFQNRLTAERLASRWRVALHEAGHVVTGRAFGPLAKSAAVLANGGGLTSWPAGGCFYRAGWPAAVVALAGDVALELLGDEPPPRLPEGGAPPEAIAEADGDGESWAVAAEAAHASATHSDADILADYVATERDWRTWGERASEVHSACERILVERCEAVLAIARELFQRGHAEGPRLAELLGEGGAC